MNYQGVLKKMKTEDLETIQYYLDFNSDFLNINQLLDYTLNIHFVKYQCLCCGKNKKIYRQGFCYDCFYKTPVAGDWIMRPELSTAHLGIEDRDLAYEKKVQLQPHIVYLANSSNLKVGVTRKQQIPTRWIDQGASEAIVLVEVPNRYLAGLAEVALKEYVSDKTNWRIMLKNEVPNLNLIEEKNRLKEFLPDEVKPYYLANNQKVFNFNFPVLRYPEKIKSLNLNKTPNYSGKLKGIKGQYLIFEDNTVFNVRNYEGFVIKLTMKK